MNNIKLLVVFKINQVASVALHDKLHTAKIILYLNLNIKIELFRQNGLNEFIFILWREKNRTELSCLFSKLNCNEKDNAPLLIDLRAALFEWTGAHEL